MFCTHCCFFSRVEESPVVFEHEVNRLRSIANKLGITLKFEAVQPGLYRWILKGFCPFYNLLARRCMIHEEKPLACKMYPLLLNLKTGEINVSGLCDWVHIHFEELKNIDPVSVFPVEFQLAVELFKRNRIKVRSGKSERYR
jgi:hypothetical protein